MLVERRGRAAWEGGGVAEAAAEAVAAMEAGDARTWPAANQSLAQGFGAREWTDRPVCEN